MGSTKLPPGPMPGGSNVTSTVGSAVHNVGAELKEQIAALTNKEGSPCQTRRVKQVKAENLIFAESNVALKQKESTKISYQDLFRKNNLPGLEVTKEFKGQKQPFSMYSFSMHFVKLRVHPATGRVKIDHVVSCADAGTIISPKTAASQIIGGAVGGMGMALMEDLVVDHRFDRPIHNNLYQHSKWHFP